MPETRYKTIYDENGNVLSQEPYVVSDAELLEEAGNYINSLRIQLNSLEERLNRKFEAFTSGLPDRIVRIEEFLKQLFPSISP